jgi:hypothetical protein
MALSKGNVSMSAHLRKNMWTCEPGLSQAPEPAKQKLVVIM